MPGYDSIRINIQTGYVGACVRGYRDSVPLVCKIIIYIYQYRVAGAHRNRKEFILPCTCGILIIFHKTIDDQDNVHSRPYPGRPPVDINISGNSDPGREPEKVITVVGRIRGVDVYHAYVVRILHIHVAHITCPLRVDLPLRIRNGTAKDDQMIAGTGQCEGPDDRLRLTGFERKVFIRGRTGKIVESGIARDSRSLAVIIEHYF